MLSEKIELLGKGQYEDKIPNELTLKNIPTISELDYVGGEDFDKIMLEKILPQAVDEDIPFIDLLEIDFQWVCRCLRFLNYGPYHTTNSIFCDKCGKTSYGEYQVNLQTIACKPLPDGFVNLLTIKREEFIDFEGDIQLKLPTIQAMLNAGKDKQFQNEKGIINKELARICYMIVSMAGHSGLTPVDVRLNIDKMMSPADIVVLKALTAELTDFGLRAGGSAQCPSCHSLEAAFIATDDRFFRPTLGNLRKWKDDKRAGEDKDVSGSKATDG